MVLPEFKVLWQKTPLTYPRNYWKGFTSNRRGFEKKLPTPKDFSGWTLECHLTTLKLDYERTRATSPTH